MKSMNGKTMKKNRKQPTGNHVFLLLLILLSILCAVCSKKSSVRSEKTTTDVIPNQVLINPRIIITENGNTTAIIKSKIVKIFEDSNFTSLEDSVNINFFNKAGEHTKTLTAHAGEVWGLYENVDSLKAKGNVLIVSVERDATMRTESIRWIASSHRVYGDGPVTITSEKGFEQGVGFVAKDDLSEYEFTGPVSGEFRGEDFRLIDR